MYSRTKYREGKYTGTAEQSTECENTQAQQHKVRNGRTHMCTAEQSTGCENTETANKIPKRKTRRNCKSKYRMRKTHKHNRTMYRIGKTYTEYSENTQVQ